MQHTLDTMLRKDVLLAILLANRFVGGQLIQNSEWRKHSCLIDTWRLGLFYKDNQIIAQ